MKPIWVGGNFALTGCFAWLFYERYWKWRDCIDTSASSCVTPDGGNLTAGGMFWAIFAAAFLALALYSLFSRR
jgi:hypothetical protein